jgi:hypothetical protein
MKFTPLSKRYRFDDTLMMGIPDYLHQPIANWIYSVLRRKNAIVEPDGLYRNSPYFTKDFREILNVNMRESYPQDWNEAINFILSSNDRTLTILQWCLNYYARRSEAFELEYSLSNGGMGYAVQTTKKDASEYDDGVFDLVERVPEVVKKAADLSFDTNAELLVAWRACYGKNPNYNEAVQICQNVLEGLLKNTYLPKDPKAQLGKLIADIRSGKTLMYKGSNIPSSPNDLLNIIQNVPQYRGMHKAGSGKDAGTEEAEFVLQVTILIWNIHQKAKKA